MKPIITKADFIGIVPFTLNVPDRIINPYIEDVQVYELQSKFPDALLTALYALPAVPIIPEDQPQLRAFYDEFVKRYVVLLAYIRFIAEHGINVTQFGLTQTKDPAGTIEPVDKEDRAVVLRGRRSDANMALANMNKALEKSKYTFDGVAYVQTKATTGRPNIGISGIRAKEYQTGYILKGFIDGVQ